MNVRFGVCYDFRNPPDGALTNPELYHAVLRQIAWLDGLGVDQVWFTEHHFIEDGYLPSWIPVASAAAALTKHIRLSTDICLLPFSNPLRLAEDLAVLDNLSGGRVELGVGLGYAPHEFRGFGIPVSRRVSLMEEGLDVLKLAFAGERFSYHGKRYQFEDAMVTPRFVQPGGPPLWIAAMAAPGADRAVRHRTNFLPQGDRTATLDRWREQLSADGDDPSDYRVGLLKGVLVTDDAERDWPPVRNSERYRMQLYQRFFAASETDFGAGEHISQRWVVGTEDECIAELTEFMGGLGLTDLVTWGAPPGLHPDTMADSLERFATRVAPAVKANLEGGER